MKLYAKKALAVLTATVTAFAACACSDEIAESSFDNPLPWHDSVELAPTGSYEQLVYAVDVYDTTKGASDVKRVFIGNGEMSFTLQEFASGYTTLDMTFTVTYDQNAPEPDAGLTDTIYSSVDFETNSLSARRMTKTVNLADRKDKQNDSYEITADYFGTHKATYKQTKIEDAKERVKSLPKDACRDNEMMFFLARAQKIGKNTSTNFKMVNVFDTFVKGKLTEYTMAVSSGEKKVKVDIGNFVQDFGVEAVTDEKTGEVSYPISCFNTSISINAERHGPPYSVLYTEKPFVINGKEHKKIPIKISYNEYKGSSPYRMTEYTLTSCSFDAPPEANS